MNLTHQDIAAEGQKENYSGRNYTKDQDDELHPKAGKKSKTRISNLSLEETCKRRNEGAPKGQE